MNNTDWSFENKKDIRVKIKLGQGTFGPNKGNEITIQGLRTIVEISHGSGAQMSTMNLRIYGLSQDHMNSSTLTQFHRNFNIYNFIEVTAINGSREDLVFIGTISNAWPDYTNAPDVCLFLSCYNGLSEKTQIDKTFQKNGDIDVDQTLKSLITKANQNWKYESYGVVAKLTDPHYQGSPYEQARQIAEDCHYSLVLDRDTVIVTAPGFYREGVVPFISYATGMIGYPLLDAFGVSFRTIFNPEIRMMGHVKIDSTIPAANGRWLSLTISHKLESNKPNGAWMSNVRCVYHDF